MENNEKELEEIKAIEERELKELELMNENENREFYVYLHIRLDNMTPFYVGKGKRDRAYNLDRGNFHNCIRDEYGCKVVIIKDKLTESQAFRLEKRMIEYYVLTLGYGIPIDGYRDFSNNKYLTNFTWGGEGASGLNPYANKTKEEMETIGKKISEKISGEKNGMFGKNPFAKKTEEEMEVIANKKSNSMKGKMVGEKNPMYGKNPYANKTEEEMEIIGRKISEKVKGKNSFENKTKEEMEIISNKISNSLKGKNAGEKSGMWGKPAPNRSKVICITTCKIFDCIKDAGNHYNVAYSNISNCCKGKRKSAGKLKDGTPLQWKYYYDNESKEYNESK